MSDRQYASGPFDGGTFANDPKTGEHVTRVEPDATASGFRVYRIILSGEFTPIVSIDSPSSIVVKDEMDWHPEGCTVTFDDGCNMTAVVPIDCAVVEVRVIRWVQP